MNSIRAKLIVGLLILVCLPLHAEPVTYENIPDNVAYSKVTQLKFRQPEYKIPYGQALQQYGLLWQSQQNLANQQHTTKPLIVFVHGGCWLNAYDIKHTYPIATSLSQAGYNVWSLEYRRTGDNGGGWPGTFEDIMLGIKHLQELDLENINVSKIILMGHSAGGHLALLAAADLLAKPMAKIELSATIGLAAISDIKLYAEGSNSCQTATPKFMQSSFLENPAAYAAANPVSKKLPAATFLMQGNADTIVPAEQAKIAGVNEVVVDEAGHFDWIHPGSEAYRKLRSTLQTILSK